MSAWKMVLRCYMPGCTNKGRFGFHKFPRKVEICMKWQHISRRRNLDTKKLPDTHYRLCEKHFKIDDYLKSCNRNRHLKKNAVPSVLIPEESSVYEEHNYIQLSISDQEEQTNSQFETHERKTISQPITNSHSHTPDRIVDNINPSVTNHQHSSPATNDQKLPPKTQRKEEEKVRRQLRYSSARIKFLQKKLKESKNLTKDKVIQYLSSKFTKEQMTFFIMQLRNSGCKNHGQRYTTEEKCMLLSVYKHGPKAYRFISQLFSLPSKRTLNRHSALLQFKTGINPKLFQFLKSKASQMEDLDKYCTLSWDEMAVTTHLNFSEATDAMDGFVDYGEVAIPEFATHALVFMIRGVNSAYKQPIAYFFTNNLNSKQLSELITLVVCEVLNTGMKIIGSVCDQTGTNATAVNLLAHPNLRNVKQNGQLLSYTVQGNIIIHCFDPPHIIKVIRNNLYSKNLKHFASNVWDYNSENETAVENEAECASWDDVRQFYTIAKPMRLIRKITAEHIDPKARKMSVAVAAQVFSNTFGNIMLYYSKHNQLLTDFSGTANILIFFNNVFDSLNGGGKSNVNPLRSAINMKNQEKLIKFWEYAISMIEKMNFVDKSTGSVNNKSSVLKKTISTIKGYMELTKLCLSLGIKSVSLRRMNQDGLENFFGNIKSGCQASKQPMAFQFRSNFTNLIVTNLSAKHSMRSNCQDDKSVALLQDVYDFYDLDYIENEDEFDDDEDIIEMEEDIVELDIDIEEVDLNLLVNDASVYESSNVCKDVLLTIKCEACKNTLEAYCPLTQHGIIKQCEITSNAEHRIFTYPTLFFMSHFKALFYKAQILLPFICHENFITRKLLTSLGSDGLDGLGCPEHSTDISEKMKKAIVKLNIDIFRKQINDILRKKNLEPLENQPDIYNKAFKIVKQKKGVGKYGQVAS